MKKDRIALINSGHKLIALGVKVENERENLRRLVECGTPYDSQLMLTALEKFEKIDAEWKRKEAEHLEIKKRLGDL
ncbi:MAG: hypothetical protein FWH16_03205 [Oscillospiraceae bacterium]|nr:hypothetical protein [Oscillospiraceae bacterium]